MRRSPTFHPRALAALALPGVAVLLMLVPYLRAGFFFDDIYNSVTHGQLIARGRSLPDVVGELLQHWVWSSGRFFPLAVLSGYPLWDVADSLWKSRLIQCGLAVADIALLHLLVRRLAGSRVALVSVLMLPLVVQFNPRWDGLSSFMPLNQVVLLLSLAGCFAALRACETGRRTPLAVSVVAVVLGLLTYEVGVVGWLGALAIGWACRRQAPVPARRLILAHLAAGGAYFVLYALVRMNSAPTYDGIQAGTLAGVVSTFAAQYLSAFPFAFLSNDVLPPVEPHWRGVAAVFLVLAVVWGLALRPGRPVDTPGEPASHTGTAWILALMLSAIPAAILSASARYQTIVRYGDPYIVVYIQYFGVALLLALAGAPLWRRVQASPWLLVAILPLAAASALTISANKERIDTKNVDFRWPREQMEGLVRQGLLDPVPAGSLLLVQSPHVWEYLSDGEVSPGLGLCAAFFSQHAGKPLRCMALEDYLNTAPGGILDVGDASAGIHVLRRLPAPDRQGAVELVGPGVSRTAAIDKSGTARFAAGPSRLPVLVMLGAGFYGWEPAHAQDFAWSPVEAELVVYNLGRAPRQLRARFGLQSALDQRIVITAAGRPLFDGFVKGGPIHPIDAEATLQPGRNVIRLQPAGTAVSVGSSDPRTFSFRIFQPKFE